MNAHHGWKVVVVLLAASSAAGAASITVDPDTYPSGDPIPTGSVINNAYPGVMLSAQEDPPPGVSYLETNDVLARAKPLGSPGGINVFGYDPVGSHAGLAWGDGFYNWLRADFAGGASSVSLNFIADSINEINPVLRAFDGSGTEVGSATSPGYHPKWSVVTLTVENPNIAYVQAEGNIGGGSGWLLDYLVYEPAAQQVTVDIKPGSDPNTINLGSNGNVPVAVLSTPDFDATTIDPTTVTLADAGVKVRGKGVPMSSTEDVNGDGLLDMILHIDTTGLLLTVADETAVLTGATLDGIAIQGSDAVRIIYNGDPAPEPASLALLALAGLGLMRRRRR